MCTCTSCEFTDKYAGKSFAEWPRGAPKGKAKSEAEYRAHVAHAFAGASKSIGFKPGQAARFPVTGTERTDPRIWYHFPGGQQGKHRPTRDQAALGLLIHRETYPGAEDNPARYVEAFLRANHLTADGPPKRAASPGRPRSRKESVAA